MDNMSTRVLFWVNGQPRLEKITPEEFVLSLTRSSSEKKQVTATKWSVVGDDQ